jgi:fructose-bisphosphate aldolase class I
MTVKVEMSSPLQATVAAMLARGKGILAADEPAAIAERRFEASGVVSAQDTRRDYREMLFATPGLSNFISAAIMVEETLRQDTAAGVPMPRLLDQAGIVPGVSVDNGTVPLAGFPGEELTEGLDGLRVRLDEYRALGARFTKWRAVITIGEQLPTRACIEINALALALFAALSQEAGLVPLVEPDILMKGGHSLARCEEVACATLERVFAALVEHRVALEHMVLKTGMILSGAQCPQPAELQAVAEATLRCLRRAVPAVVPGIVFLSGGQSDAAVTERLNAICRAGDTPWRLSFSFSRALQAAVLAAWKGLPGNVPRAQAALSHRARCNSAATEGAYSSGMEVAGGAESI